MDREERASAPPAGLVAAFRERGYAGPVPLLTREECRALLARLRHDHERPPLDWNKGWAATSTAWYALAADDRILDLVTALLGDDVILWGAGRVVRGSGRVHPWHTDVESASPEGETVSVWIGLAGTNADSSLRVVPYSHRFGVALQEAALEQGRAGEDVRDEEVAAWARERDSRSGIEVAVASDGDALLFDGRLWHGSHNRNRRGYREAALLQYATPRTPIRMFAGDRGWPRAVRRAPKPPCILVGGRDVEALNRLVPGPVERSGGDPALTSGVHDLRVPLPQDARVGWKPHHLFRGATPGLRRLGCHVSVLDPGRSPHLPHRHDEEELLLVLDGEADLLVEAAGDSEATARVPVARGTFSYYPAGFAHTLENTAAASVTYLMLKWVGDRGAPDKPLAHRVVVLPEITVPGNVPPPERTGQRLLDGETGYLRRLRAHVTTLQPGAGYEPHVDAYDVAIVVLEGTVETLGERLGPHGVAFSAAGEPHGMRNVGAVPAVYLVFELHGRHTALARPTRPSRTRRLAGVVLRPVGRLRRAARGLLADRRGRAGEGPGSSRPQ